MVYFHKEEYKQSHRYSTCQPRFHMIYAEPRGLRNKHFQQYRSVFHLSLIFLHQIQLNYGNDKTKYVEIDFTWLYVIRESKVNGLQRGALVFGDEQKILLQFTKTMSIRTKNVITWKIPISIAKEMKAIRRTSGFRSRWTTPWRWQYATTLNICTITTFASSSEYFPPLEQQIKNY